jgi:dynein heavy chain, axonemal
MVLISQQRGPQNPTPLAQAFVDASFEHIVSTDHALELLAQFTEVLQRDALQQQLEGKWAVIFQHYARDLEAVQAAYEANKSKPPLPRNAPPIVGGHRSQSQLCRHVHPCSGCCLRPLWA